VKTASELAKNVRALVLDVDGVLTDGGLYYDAHGGVTKRFHVQDGLGIKLAQAAGIEVAVITGLSHEAVETRVRELGIREYHHGHVDKLPLLERVRYSLGLELHQMAYLGDDWVDAGPMRVVGLPMAVANAQPEILGIAAWVSKTPGGGGAVREAVRFILESRGELESGWREWSGA
jgi:3-deoxy-D-manno-octulosonate 8-phosphate phosphatase (KDO 8-P phosphatase)